LYFIIAKYSNVGYCSADLVLVNKDWLLKLTIPAATASYDVIICETLINENTDEQLHATVFICDKRTATIAWHDPHGKSQFIKKIIGRTVLNVFSAALKFKFNHFYPPSGKNSLQIAYVTNYKDVIGYCLYWTFAIIDFYLLNYCKRNIITDIGRILRDTINKMYKSDNTESSSKENRLKYIREYMMYSWRMGERFSKLLGRVRYNTPDNAFLRGLYLRNRKFLNFGKNLNYVYNFAAVSKKTDDIVKIYTKDGNSYSFLTNNRSNAKLAFFLIHIAKVRSIRDYDCELLKEPWRISLFDSRTTTKIGESNLKKYKS